MKKVAFISRNDEHNILIWSIFAYHFPNFEVFKFDNCGACVKNDSSDFDLIILDLTRPECARCSNIAVTLSNDNRVPFIVISGEPEEDLAQHVLFYDALVSTPVNPDSFVTLVKALVIEYN